jgi:8-oxo-dGTP pyrophosphatase MutT (NUDIX family)
MPEKKRDLRPISFSEEETIFQNRFMRLFRIDADFGEFTREYYVAAKGGKVGVMIWKDDKILLVRQYRFVIDDMSWELPGGGLKPGESLEEAAIRECREEAGIEPGSVKPYFSFQHSVDVTKSPGHIFEAVDIVSEGALPANDETDARMWLPADEFVDKIVSGEIREPMTIIALLMHAAT